MEKQNLKFIKSKDKEKMNKQNDSFSYNNLLGILENDVNEKLEREYSNLKYAKLNISEGQDMFKYADEKIKLYNKIENIGLDDKMLCDFVKDEIDDYKQEKIHIIADRNDDLENVRIINNNINIYLMILEKIHNLQNKYSLKLVK
jgi:hypothetical protein